MEHTATKIRICRWLMPLSWVYGAAVGLRNRLFDTGVLPQERFDVPTVCIGNLAVGGTGKTPMTEYLIRLLQAEGLHVATLSRGYGRRSKGYVEVKTTSTADEAGDEPLQMKRKFPDVIVAVCEDRRKGIRKLTETTQERPDVILLDDAMQHRYVHAGHYILLTDYSRLYCDDCLLPAGRLRESRHGADRAQTVVVTKCPDQMTAAECDDIRRRLCLKDGQRLYFSHIQYEGDSYQGKSVLLLTGIANPEPLARFLQSKGADIKRLTYADHHRFGQSDAAEILKAYDDMKAKDKLIVTTEKDEQRLRPLLDGNLGNLRDKIRTVRIAVGIMGGKEEEFNKNIIDYVRKDT